MNNYLISYDISNDALRQKIAKYLTAQGCVRLQKSVHLAPKYEYKEIEQLKKNLHHLILKTDKHTDSIICLPVSDTDMDSAYWAGNREVWKKIKDPPLHNML